MVEIMEKEEQKKEDTDRNNLSVISKAVEEERAEPLDLLLQAGSVQLWKQCETARLSWRSQ